MEPSEMAERIRTLEDRTITPEAQLRRYAEDLETRLGDRIERITERLERSIDRINRELDNHLGDHWRERR
jgi:uncharacterized protein Yka (UPF0111/DUF47 family)